MNKETTVVYGPKGCGKTYHGDTLRALFGGTHVVDEWTNRMKLTEGAVHLSLAPPSLKTLAETPFSVRVVDFATLGLTPPNQIKA